MSSEGLEATEEEMKESFDEDEQTLVESGVSAAGIDLTA